MKGLQLKPAVLRGICSAFGHSWMYRRALSGDRHVLGCARCGEEWPGIAGSRLREIRYGVDAKSPAFVLPNPGGWILEPPPTIRNRRKR